MKYLALLAMFAVAFSFGCTDAMQNQSSRSSAVTMCISLCNDALLDGEDLSDGSCLSDDNSDWDIDEWVCYAINNSCRDFLDGNATHFVEVSEKCDFIRAV
mgnify:CR=1 FL=1